MEIAKLAKLIVWCSAVALVMLNLAPGVARADMTVIVADSYGTAHTIPGGNDGWGTHGGEFLTKPSGFTFTPDRVGVRYRFKAFHTQFCPLLWI